MVCLDVQTVRGPEWASEEQRLQQVLSNYLTNALKFAPASAPVHVGLAVEGASVRVWVQDHGPGLTQEQQAHIWDQFYQVAQTPVQSGWKVGLGLGLYICQRLMQRQQGEVGVESVPGQGATFWFTLPVSCLRDSSSAHEPEPPSPGSPGAHQ